MTEGELQKRIKKLNEEFPYDFGYDMGIGSIIEDTKKELEGILSADMPDFQKLLAISAFKNEWFGEK